LELLVNLGHLVNEYVFFLLMSEHLFENANTFILVSAVFKI